MFMIKRKKKTLCKWTAGNLVENFLRLAITVCLLDDIVMMSQGDY